MRIAIAGLFEEVNTFAAESMGFATVTGNMTTGCQQWADNDLIDGDVCAHTKQDIVDRTAAALPLDGVALKLHGAG